MSDTSLPQSIWKRWYFQRCIIKIYKILIILVSFTITPFPYPWVGFSVHSFVVHLHIIFFFIFFLHVTWDRDHCEHDLLLWFWYFSGFISLYIIYVYYRYLFSFTQGGLSTYSLSFHLQAFSSCVWCVKGK